MLKLNQKYVEKIFYNYDKIKQAIYETKNDPASNKTCGNNSVHILVSDPTSNMALREAMGLHKVVIDMGKNQDSMVIQYPEKWLKVVDYTYEYFKNKQTGKITYDVITRKYKNDQDYRQISMEVGISQATCFLYVKEANQYAILCAVGLQLMTPFSK